MPQSYKFPYRIGDPVSVDGDGTLKAKVVALIWRCPEPEVQVSWIHEGTIKFEWLPLWRLASDAS